MTPLPSYPGDDLDLHKQLEPTDVPPPPDDEDEDDD